MKVLISIERGRKPGRRKHRHVQHHDTTITQQEHLYASVVKPLYYGLRPGDYMTPSLSLVWKDFLGVGKREREREEGFDLCPQFCVQTHTRKVKGELVAMETLPRTPTN